MRKFVVVYDIFYLVDRDIKIFGFDRGLIFIVCELDGFCFFFLWYIYVCRFCEILEWML